MRHASMYRAPFRIREREADQPEPAYGTELNQTIALEPGGPLYAQGPGDLSRWMALPWQGDTAFCRSGYDPDYDPYLPSFWPARVPNQVLTADDYAIVIDTSLPRAQRLAAFSRRAKWLRALTGPAPQQMMQMIAGFGAMGIVEARPGITNDPDFPAVIFVESLATPPVTAAPVLLGATSAGPDAGTARVSTTRLEEAGWESAEQLQEFLSIVAPRHGK